MTCNDGVSFTYDNDGNMTYGYIGGKNMEFSYDSANRLISQGNNTYIYDVNGSRIKTCIAGELTTYVHDCTGRLSRLLVKQNSCTTVKYVYGLGLIGEENNGTFKTYHFDYRGSTVAITNTSGNVTDTFSYDTYGGIESHSGSTDTPFMYNGRDGVMSDSNGLIFMRARYYSPDIKRFINADVLAGSISDTMSMNRYAYANANPVSNVDPLGLSREASVGPTPLQAAYIANHIYSFGKTDIERPKLEGGWRYLEDQLIQAGDGMVMGVYMRVNNGKTEYVLANKGTTSWSPEETDLKNNLGQPLGWSADMTASIAAAKKFVESHPNDHITFVGHSKGGGEALANARATNKDAIVFNPAVPNYLEYIDNSLTEYTATAKSYVIKGEILSDVYFLAGSVIAWEAIEEVFIRTSRTGIVGFYPPLINTPFDVGGILAAYSSKVFQSPVFWETEWLEFTGKNVVDAHSRQNVITALGGEL